MKNLEPFLLCERSSEPFVLLCVLRAPLRDLCGKTFLTESVQKIAERSSRISLVHETKRLQNLSPEA